MPSSPSIFDLKVKMFHPPKLILLLMNRVLTITGFAICVLSTSLCAGQEIKDNFSQPDFEARVAERGQWKFENNIASCESDPELYKKYKNHGPIIKWPSKEGFTDCTTEFEFQPNQCQRIVFTFNGDGHVFRISLLDPSRSPGKKKNAKSRVIGWKTKSSKENKGDSMMPDGLPTLDDLNGKWVKLKIVVSGDEVDMTIGGFHKTFAHDSLKRDKNVTTLSFAQGSMSLRNFRFSSAVKSKEAKRVAVKEIQAIQTLPEEIRKQTKSLNPNYAVHAPDADHNRKLPLVIFLHGGGGNGDSMDDIKQLHRRTTGLIKKMKRVGKEPCYFVVPQCARGEKPERGIWQADDLDLLLSHLKSSLRIDDDRVYLTGTSMGGFGTWCWAAASPENFAAVAPVCGGTGPGGPKDVTKDFDQWAKSLTRVPLWAFHGEDDKIVPFSRSKDMVNAIKKHGGKQVKLTAYPNTGHDAGGPAYGDPELYKWMFSKRRSSENE